MDNPGEKKDFKIPLLDMSFEDLGGRGTYSMELAFHPPLETSIKMSRRTIRPMKFAEHPPFITTPIPINFGGTTFPMKLTVKHPLDSPVGKNDSGTILPMKFAVQPPLFIAVIRLNGGSIFPMKLTGSIPPKSIPILNAKNTHDWITLCGFLEPLSREVWVLFR
jgi:hypothetical protein